MPSISAIRARRSEISQQIERLRAEDEELRAVERVLQRLSAPRADEGEVLVLPDSGEGRSRLRDFRTPRSQREFVLDALATSEQAWLRSDEIIEHARKTWGVVISELSLRPLLSVMKRDGQIVRQGRALALPERAQSGRRQRTPPR
jgi:hypothetical protein